MRLSFNLEYSGNCNSVLDFYASVFNNAFVNVKTFKEMDMAEVLGITGPRLDMVWQSELCIPYEDGVLCMEMSDSLMTAMQKGLDFNGLYYNPVICIAHDDENYIRDLLKKLYKEEGRFERLQNGNDTDPYGIRWEYQKSRRRGMFYCLTFDGFCGDVISFYENVFQIKAAEIIKYGDSPYKDKIPAAGADKIYGALLQFKHGNRTCALKLRDSYDSAMDGINRYDPNALLFYQKFYNPVFTLRENDTVYLSESFKRLMNGAKLNREMTPDGKGSVYGSLIDKYGICWNFYSVTEDISC